MPPTIDAIPTKNAGPTEISDTMRFLVAYRQGQTDMNTMQSILFVSAEGHVGGAEKSLLLLLKHLKSHFAVSLACPTTGSLLPEAAKMNIPCHPFADGCCRGKDLVWAMWLLRAVLSLRRIIGHKRPVIIHANNLQALIICIFPARIARIPLIWHVRDLPRRRHLILTCSRLCTRIIAVSNSIKRALIRAGVNGRLITVIHNGVDTDNLHFGYVGTTSSEAPELCREFFVFANIGQFVRWKRQLLFVEAAEMVAKLCSNAKFLMVGDDVFDRDKTYKEEVLARIAHSAAGNKMRWLGWHENMEEVWSTIDCLVHTADTEPFGRVILEAMAHRIPVISVNGGGPSEIIRSGSTGILVEPENPTQLSEAMIRMINDRTGREKLAAEAFQRVCSHFTSEQTAQRVKDLYVELLAA
jgi:glycosyltransferase involved in cell wall biosynthesis